MSIHAVHAVSDERTELAEQAALLTRAFAVFDAQCSPPASGQPALSVLAPWLEFLAADVEFLAGNGQALFGHAAVAGYFEPLLPALTAVVHELLTISPVIGPKNAWTVRGILRIRRRRDGNAITPIPFTDTLFLDAGGRHIIRYEIRFDPAPIGELFAPD